MYVNIEFLDTEPMENVITALHYNIDKTMFIGFHDVVEAYKDRTQFFLNKYCDVETIKFVEVPENDLQAILAAISTEVNNEKKAGNTVFFDITGGEGLILMAFGMLAKDYNLPIHQFDVETDEMKEFKLGDAKLISQYDIKREHKVKLTLDSYIRMWGAQINRKPEDNKDKLPIHDKKYMEVVEELMLILDNCGADWNKFTAGMGQDFKAEGLDVDVTVNPNEMYKWETFKEFLRKLNHAGAIYGYEAKDVSGGERVKFHYPSWDMKRTILKSGNIFELQVYQAKKKKEGSQDCDMGVKIDWDGNVNAGGVYNEIDVLGLNGNILTFVSCKGGNMDGNASLEPMYQIDAIASRFGGKYARKILATRERVKGVYAERAEAMKIKLECY